MDFRYCPNYFGNNVFGPGFFLDIVPFQSKEDGPFFGLCDDITLFIEPITSLRVHVLNLACFIVLSLAHDHLRLGTRSLPFSARSI